LGQPVVVIDATEPWAQQVKVSFAPGKPSTVIALSVQVTAGAGRGAAGAPVACSAVPDGAGFAESHSASAAITASTTGARIRLEYDPVARDRTARRARLAAGRLSQRRAPLLGNDPLPSAARAAGSRRSRRLHCRCGMPRVVRRPRGAPRARHETLRGVARSTGWRRTC
jgi:hypothetical protein